MPKQSKSKTEVQETSPAVQTPVVDVPVEKVVKAKKAAK